jgi:hypothetical protein
MKTALFLLCFFVATAATAAKLPNCVAQCETLSGISPVLVAVYFWPSDEFSLDRRNEISYDARNAVLAILHESRIPVRDDATGGTPHLLIWVQFSGSAYSIQSFVVEDVKIPRFRNAVPVHTWETSLVGFMPRRSNLAIVNAIAQQARIFATDYHAGNAK